MRGEFPFFVSHCVGVVWRKGGARCGLFGSDFPLFCGEGLYESALANCVTEDTMLCRFMLVWCFAVDDKWNGGWSWVDEGVAARGEEEFSDSPRLIDSRCD